jgi:N-acetyl-gamma-glutamyl-phosphate reductase
MNKIKVGIIGGAGYTGGELLRILLQHAFVEISFVHSNSNAHKPVYSVHEDLVGETNLVFSANYHFNIDVLFLCAGHGEGKKFLLENEVPLQVKVIDIGNDFRLQANAYIKDRTFVYGLPEVNIHTIKTANSIANPGCFATAIQLSILPLAKEGLLQQVCTTGITGSTGAGQSLSASSHFSWRANNIQAYKTLTHQHLAEIHETLNSFNNTTSCHVNFVPWRGNFTRGIFVSSIIPTALSLQELTDVYSAFYKAAAFTHITTQQLHLKQVINTNKCVIQLEKNNETLVVHAAIDNLLKGASGQAVQNMNLLFGFKETEGLQLKSIGF